MKKIIIKIEIIIIVIILLGVLGAVIISRQRLKIKNERLTGEQDRQIYRAQRELMQAEAPALFGDYTVTDGTWLPGWRKV